MSSAETYAHWVLNPSNAVKTGQYIKLAAKRFLSDLKREDIYFDEHEANRICIFAERYCCLWEDKWRGEPIKIMPWMAFFIQQVYGWYRKDSGLRRINRVYVQIAKKNAKTTIAGLFGNYHLYDDKRIQTPKIFVGANNEDQAKICVNITGKIIEQSPALMEYVDEGIVRIFRYKENIINIVHEERDGFIKALSKEGSDRTSKTSGGKHGINPSLGIIDEYGLASDDNLLNTLQSAQAARAEPLILCITTAGFNKDGPCFQKLRKTGIGVLEGLIQDDSYLPIIYEMDSPEVGELTIDYLMAHPEIWDQANPNLDVSVFRDFLVRELTAAKNEGGSKEVSVMTLNFNRWVDAAEVFISADIWNKNTHGTDEKELDGQQCYVGIEIAPAGEMSAVAFLFPGDTVKIKMLFFLAEETLKTNEVYRQYKDLIKIDSGNVVDNDVAVGWVLDDFSKYQVHSFCFANKDKTNSIVQGIIKSGYEGNPISQGVQGISSPTEEWEKLIRSGQVEHFGNPLLAWQNSNCLAIRKEIGTRLEKNGKVYGIWACINALAQWKSILATGNTDTSVEIW